MTIPERGLPVIVRTYGGRPEIRFLFEARAAGFIVTEIPDDDSMAVGIPSRDVFGYDPRIAGEIADGKIPDWSCLTLYRLAIDNA